MQRGFAAGADRLATAVRLELGLGPHDRLDTRGLAVEYGITVVPITDLVSEGADPASVRQLTVVDDGCFSAGTVMVDTNRLIIFNPAHSSGRLANSLTHEIAHLLLEHNAGPGIGPGGCRVWDQNLEDEADLLAGILLVPRDAALTCARAGLPHEIGAARFGVSSPLMKWRTDHSGASRRSTAEARKRGRKIPRLSKADVAELSRASDPGWLIDLTAREWRDVLAAYGRALAAGSIADVAACLRRPTPVP